MKLFSIIISASLLFLQGIICANGDELVSEIASEANEVLAAAHGDLSRSTSPIDFWDHFLQPNSPERVRRNDRSLHHRDDSFGLISVFSLSIMIQFLVISILQKQTQQQLETRLQQQH